MYYNTYPVDMNFFVLKRLSTNVTGTYHNGLVLNVSEALVSLNDTYCGASNVLGRIYPVGTNSYS